MTLTNCALNRARHTTKAMNSNYFSFLRTACEATATFQSNWYESRKKVSALLKKEERAMVITLAFPNFTIPDCALQSSDYLLCHAF